MTKPGPNVPDTLYHYTSLAGLWGIGSQKRLRATSIRHLSDATEFKYAHDVLLTELQRKSHGSGSDVLAMVEVLLSELDFSRVSTALAFSDPLGTTFVTSFSQNKDQLSQWRAYCSSGGVSLGFRIAALQTIAKEQGFQLIPCSYARSEHVRDAEALAEQLLEMVSEVPAEALRKLAAGGKRITADIAHHVFPIRRRMLDEIQRRAPGWKHPSFHEEAEWRLVSNQTPADGFRIGRTALIPYVNIRLDDPPLLDGDVSIVLSECVVGPCAEPELAVGSVMHFLGHEKLACSSFILSNTPYREW